MCAEHYLEACEKSWRRCIREDAQIPPLLLRFVSATKPRSLGVRHFKSHLKCRFSRVGRNSGRGVLLKRAAGEIGACVSLVGAIHITLYKPAGSPNPTLIQMILFECGYSAIQKDVERISRRVVEDLIGYEADSAG